MYSGRSSLQIEYLMHPSSGLGSRMCPPLRGPGCTTHAILVSFATRWCFRVPQRTCAQGISVCVCAARKNPLPRSKITRNWHPLAKPPLRLTTRMVCDSTRCYELSSRYMPKFSQDLLLFTDLRHRLPRQRLSISDYVELLGRRNSSSRRRASSS